MDRARCELAGEFPTDLRHLDAQLRETKKKLAAAVRTSGTSPTGLFGVGPVIAGTVIGAVGDVSRFSGPGPVRRLQRHRARGGILRRPAGLPALAARQPRDQPRVHMAAITQIRNKHSGGRAYYDKKVAEGKTHKEALRALKRRISDAIYAALVADARQAEAAGPQGPGGQPGNLSESRAAGSHPEHRHFGQATPRPRHHLTAAAGTQGRAGHSSIAAPLPPAKPQVQVERPQQSEDVRPGGAAKRRPYSAARKAPRGPRLASEGPSPGQPLDSNSKEDSLCMAGGRGRIPNERPSWMICALRSPQADVVRGCVDAVCAT